MHTLFSMIYNKLINDYHYLTYNRKVYCLSRSSVFYCFKYIIMLYKLFTSYHFTIYIVQTTAQIYNSFQTFIFGAVKYTLTEHLTTRMKVSYLGTYPYLMVFTVLIQSCK